MSERQDGDKIIVTGFSGGSHFPRKQEMLQYFWQANGLSKEGPFHIQGSVYGRKLEFVGPGEVEGSVMSRGDVSLENLGDGVQRFLSGITSSASILCSSNTRALQDTLMGNLDNASYIIRGNVFAAERIYLEDTIVMGQVRAKYIEIRNCIIFGSLEASEKLDIHASSILHYYSGGSVSFYGPCTFFHPMGASKTRPVAKSYKDPQNKTHRSDLRLYPIYRDNETYPFGNQSWRKDHHPDYEIAKISTKHDFIRVTAKDQDEESDYWMMSVAGRSLNYQRFEGAMSDIKDMIRTGLEFEHYSEDFKNKVRSRWSKLIPDEDRLMKMVTDNIHKGSN